MQEQKSEKVKLDFGDQFVIPIQRDLHNCRKYKIPMIFRSPYAVFVKKMASTNKDKWTTFWKDDKAVIQKDCQDFSKFDFLVNFQYKKGVTFNSDEMEYFEKVQQISELKNICMNEKDPHQTLKEFSDQLDGWVSRNNRKEIIPTLEPSTTEMEKKILLMKKKGIEKCAVIFRGFQTKEDRESLSKILATLNSLEIYYFVFGIFPTKWKKTGMSMLYPAIFFKANGVSSWVAWSGRASNMTLLCSDWIFYLVKNADKGLANYNGKVREDFIDKKNSINLNTAISQIDTINQASELLRNFKPLTKVQFEKFFS